MASRQQKVCISLIYIAFMVAKLVLFLIISSEHPKQIFNLTNKYM